MKVKSKHTRKGNSDGTPSPKHRRPAKSSKETAGTFPGTSSESVGSKPQVSAGLGTGTMLSQGEHLGKAPGQDSGDTHEAEVAAKAEGITPAQEIETPEFLEARGWKRLTLCFFMEHSPGRIEESQEIVADPTGNLWLVSDWNVKGIAVRVSRRPITKEEAIAHLWNFTIREEYRSEFSVPVPTEFPDLEQAVRMTQALLVMATDEAATHFKFTGQRGNAIRAGIADLSLMVSDNLAAAFHGHSRAS